MVIDIQIQPNGGARIMFGCRKAQPLRNEKQQIDQAIARALAVARLEASQLIN